MHKVLLWTAIYILSQCFHEILIQGCIAIISYDKFKSGLYAKGEKRKIVCMYD